MKLPSILVMNVLLASCASRSTSYRRLPEPYTAISSTSHGQTFVFEINPAFDDPVGYRFEIPSAGSEGGKRTVYSLRGSPVTTELKEEELIRFRRALQGFDWNRVEDAPNPEVITMAPDDIGILFRARIGGVSHEARVGLSSSSPIDKLLRDLDIFR